MTVTLGINGFGRIGRTTLASIFEYGRNDVIVSKVNAPGSIETNAQRSKIRQCTWSFLRARLTLTRTALILEEVPLKYYPLTMPMT